MKPKITLLPFLSLLDKIVFALAFINAIVIHTQVPLGTIVAKPFIFIIAYYIFCVVVNPFVYKNRIRQKAFDSIQSKTIADLNAYHQAKSEADAKAKNKSNKS